MVNDADLWERNSLCCCSCLQGCIWDSSSLPSVVHSGLLSPLAATCVGLGILSCTVTQIFIPEQSQCLLLMAFSGYTFCICLFTIKTDTWVLKVPKGITRTLRHPPCAQCTIVSGPLSSPPSLQERSLLIPLATEPKPWLPAAVLCWISFLCVALWQHPVFGSQDF